MTIGSSAFIGISVASSKFVDAIVNHPTLAEVDLSQNNLGKWFTVKHQPSPPSSQT